MNVNVILVTHAILITVIFNVIATEQYTEQQAYYSHSAIPDPKISSEDFHDNSGESMIALFYPRLAIDTLAVACINRCL